MNPIEKRINKRGNWQFRFERDIAGVCNIRFKGKKGEKIKVIYSDTEDKDGDLVEENSFIKNYYFQTEEYTKKSDLPEEYYTRFTYYGFFIMEVVGGDELDLDDIEAWVLCNDFKARGKFKCDDEIINKIQQMVKYSTESCCVGTLSADTVREKSSWTGDTGLTAEQIFINYESEAFMRRWMRDMREAQRPCGTFPCIIPSTGWGYVRLNGPDWSQPSVEVPLRLYLSTGDKEFLRENYDELKRHVDNMHNNSRDNIAQFGLGDWCPPFDGPAISVNMSSYKCPVRLSDTAYYYDACQNLALWAKVLSEDDEYYVSENKKYEELAKKIKEKFMSYFYGKNKVKNNDCQTALGMLLYRKLYSSEDERKYYLDKLVKVIEDNGGKLDFGVLGMKAVSNALGENGKASLCLEMLRGPEYPSYGHWVEMGSTTLYECWNGLGSHNHHMFSDVSEFFYKYIAGIQIDKDNPGYKNVIFNPCLESRIKNVECEIDTVRGKVGVSYSIKDNEANVDLVVPVGSSAEFVVNDKYKLLSNYETKDGKIYFESGKYNIKLKIDRK